jgi:hypothetical protein
MAWGQASSSRPLASLGRHVPTSSSRAPHSTGRNRRSTITHRQARRRDNDAYSGSGEFSARLVEPTELIRTPASRGPHEGTVRGDASSPCPRPSTPVDSRPFHAIGSDGGCLSPGTAPLTQPRPQVDRLTGGGRSARAGRSPVSLPRPAVPSPRLGAVPGSSCHRASSATQRRRAGSRSLHPRIGRRRSDHPRPPDARPGQPSLFSEKAGCRTGSVIRVSSSERNSSPARPGPAGR